MLATQKVKGSVDALRLEPPSVFVLNYLMSAKIALSFAIACLVALITTWILVPYFPNGHPSTGLMIFIVAAFVSTVVSLFGLTMAMISYFKERAHLTPRFRIPIIAIVLNGLIFCSIVSYAFWLRHGIIVSQSTHSSAEDDAVPNASDLIGPD